MNASRHQMLQEMGINPLWRLREAQTATEFPEAQQLSSGDDRGTGQLQHMTGEAQIRSRIVSEDLAQMDWDALEKCMSACNACPLCEHRRKVVPGIGDRRAKWLFIGEGPGAEEDARGEPFVGQAGKLLDAMLAAIGLVRGEGVYIANAVKCRPPGNRTPESEEIRACRPFLQRQIDLLEPRLIVLLGRTAAHSILSEEHGSLGSLRGKKFEYKGIPVVVTYHPAYLLRNLPEKAKAWEDLLLARRLVV